MFFIVGVEKQFRNCIKGLTSTNLLTTANLITVQSDHLHMGICRKATNTGNTGKTARNAWDASAMSRRMQCKKTWMVKLEKTVYPNDLNEMNKRYMILF